MIWTKFLRFGRFQFFRGGINFNHNIMASELFSFFLCVALSFY